jgi:DNA-binding MarR family transcriptional regulator
MSRRIDDTAIDQADLERLLAFRDGLRRFLRWSEDQAKAVGLTSAQHQLLLAVQGHSATDPPSIGDVADHLLLRHHSAVELVDRAEHAGLVRRIVDAGDHRVVRLALTAKGRGKLASLAATHLDELTRLAGELPALPAGRQRAASSSSRRS